MNGLNGSRTSRVLVSMMLGLSTLAGLALSATLTLSARAQDSGIAKITPYFAVVEKNEALLRSGGNDLMYVVMNLSPGTVLRADGEVSDKSGARWSQVNYPLGSYVLVPIDAVSVDATGRVGTLTKTARAKAPYQSSDVKTPWMDAVPQGLPAGMKVTVLGSQPATSPAQWYKIAPPDSARAFVLSSALRRATQEEINAYMTRAAQPATLKIDAPSAPTTETSKAAPAAKPAAEPSVEVTKPGTDLTQPMVIPQGGQPSASTGTPETYKPSQDASPSATPTGNTPEGTPAGDPAKPEGTHEAKPKAAPQPPANPYEKLETALERVRKQPVESAEYTELMAQYQAEIGKLDDSPANKMLRARLQQRCDYLKLLADTQAQRRTLAENTEAIDKGQKAVSEKLAELSKVRQYTIVGRLTSSTIYDGTRLPLMYRVQAASAGSPRTLAYVKPDPALKFESKIGQIVGIIGTQAIDSAVQLNIITPIRVDTLEATGPDTTPAETQKTSAEAPTGN